MGVGEHCAGVLLNLIATRKQFAIVHMSLPRVEWEARRV